MSNKRYFMMFLDYKEHLELLTDEERGKLLMALFAYADDGTIVELDGMAKMAFSFLRAQIDRDNKKYEERCAKNRDNVLNRYKDDSTNVYDRSLEATKATNVYDRSLEATKTTNTNTNTKTNKKTNTSPPYSPPEGGGERGKDDENGEYPSEGTGTSQKAKVTPDNVKTRSNVMKERFDAFWTAYPRKVGKGAAEKAWGKIKPSQQLLEAMLAAIDKAKQSEQWRRKDGQYIPNPFTWLNQKRWEDEFPPPSGPGDGRVSEIITHDEIDLDEMYTRL